ncbi:protein RRP5 homolog [Denticeps clupeoides]|uniref:Protein RRP5 homolog n=1 Tax=Denticeps clupeoides TaxID=299321 RepID=A0AAY4F0S4_9TELE|nr:protein RRP5 homolog [Denticeps clupeoides]XP_028827321.1 protein RRP5 homolog [Denticeps clupeoides]
MASAEENFPRGGATKSSPGSKPAKPRAEADNLFETREPAVKKRRKSGKKDETPLKNQKDAFKLNAPSSVDILHMKNLKVGTLLLGCVKEVADLEVVVGLPSGIVGYLPVTHICDAFTKTLSSQLDAADSIEEFSSLLHIFTPGMLIRCIVSSLQSTNDGHLILKLSINPKEVNKGLSADALKSGMTISGCVESIEDHGYLVDIGVTGTNAFMPKKMGPDEPKRFKQELMVGQYVTCLLDEVKSNGRVVRLSQDPAAVSQAFAVTQQGWTLSNLLPGLLVKAEIKQVTTHGLILDFLTSFSGIVDFMHLGSDDPSMYNIGDGVKACVLYVEPSTRLVALSLRPHLLQLEGCVECVVSDRVGDVFEGCRMTAVHHNSGAIMELPDNTRAFVHINHMKEHNETFNPNRLLAQGEHSCRIIDFSPIEQLHMVSLRASIIKAPFLRYHDLHLGQLVEGKVTGLFKFGLHVRLTRHIKGFIPRIHTADVVLQNPEKKFSVGDNIKCRVLDLDVPNRKLILTKKKALMETVLPLFTSYSESRVGRISHGFVVAVKDFGCIVRFYGNVKGLVPRGELSSEPVVVPQKLFYVGQVVKVKVLKSDPEQEKLLLSFKAVVEGESDNPKFHFEIGKKVEVKVLSKVPNGLEVAILPEGTPALLPTMHLSDHVSNCTMLWEALQDGDVISDLVTLSCSNQTIILTKKPSVKAALEDHLQTKDFSDIQVGLQLTGWVKNIMTYGVFVEFPHGLVGLAPKMTMSDKFLSSTADAFKVGQTVVAKVTNLDQEKSRFVLSLRMSDVDNMDGQSQARLLQGQKERKVVMEMLSIRDSETQELSQLRVGSKLKATVCTYQVDGSVSLVSDDLSGAAILASKHHVTDVSVTPGQKVTSVVLHVDPFTSQVHVSLLPKLLAQKKKLAVGSKHKAKVQYLDSDFAVISLGDMGHLSIIPTLAHPNETFRFESEKLAVGRMVTVTVTSPSSEDLHGLPLVSLEKPVRVAREQEPKHRYRPGDLVTVTIRSVKSLGVQLSLPGDVTGHVHMSEVVESPAHGSFPMSSLKVGTQVNARVIGGRAIRSRRFLPITHTNFMYNIPELTLLPSKLKEDADLDSLVRKPEDYEPGEEVICYVFKYDKDKKCLEVCLSPGITGSVELQAMISDPKEARCTRKIFKTGKALHAKVICVSPNRPAHLLLSLIGVHKLEEGSVAVATVCKVVPHVGLLLRLPFGAKGSVSITDLSDCFRANPLDQYHEEQLVRCCVIGRKEREGHFHLSLRPSRTHPGSNLPVVDAEVLSVEGLKNGQTLRAYVKVVGEAGIFLRLSRTITGRVAFNKATNYYVTDHSIYTRHITPDMLLTAKVLSVEPESGHVDLSLLPDDTGTADVLPESLGLPLRTRVEKKNRKRTQSDCFLEAPAVKTKKKVRTKKTSAEDHDSGVEAYFWEEETKKSSKGHAVAEKASAGPARLQVLSGFIWDSSLSALCTASAGLGHDSSEDEEEEEANKTPKKTRNQLEEEQKLAEKKLSELEVELMDPGRRPQTQTDFERLLLGSPDSSLLWLQYMAFHLQATEIEQARAIAERALKTISFREEQEKLNVWVALLNLENMYGSEESLRKVFERAVQYCEPLPVYQQLADIYAKSYKLKEAEDLYKKMVKRFRQEKAVWQNYGTFLLQQGQSDPANALLQRALKSLSSKEHVDLIAKFARLEFQYGDAERAKSMFEKVLSTYPKRTDLWSVFIDLMIKHGTQKEIRELFDRVIHLSVSVKRIKFFFKRYLEYEKKDGTAESVQVVKQKALEYVESKKDEDS